MTWEQIVILITVFGNVVAIVLSFRKLSDDSNRGAAWRANIDNGLKNLIETAKEIKDGQKENTQTIRNLTEVQIKQQGQIDSLKHEIEALKTAMQNSVNRVDNCINILKNKNLI